MSLSSNLISLYYVVTIIPCGEYELLFRTAWFKTDPTPLRLWLTYAEIILQRTEFDASKVGIT